jgi:hypothetical protein
MDIAAHIGELVMEHECVIIPGLGAFLSNYSKAEIKAKQYQIYPPKSHLVFNAQLKTNDGLLAHYLAERMGVTYKTSLALLDVFTSYCYRDLSQGKQIAFGDLGVLDLNEFGKLEFFPNDKLNFYADAFGLAPLPLKALERKPDFSLEAPIEKSTIKVSPTRVVSINRSALRKIAAILIPLAVFVAAIFYLPDRIQHKEIQETSVFSIFTSLFKSENPIPNDSNLNATVENAEINAPAKEESNGAKPELSTEKVKSEFIVVEPKTQIRGNFHIICGSFLEKERAQHFINQLKADGFSAYVVGQSPSGTYRVSLEAFDTEKEAATQLKWLRQKDFPQAWVLNKTF